MDVLLLMPEPPYPLVGGGAIRTASLLHYFARFAQVDVLQFSETGQAAPLPAGLVRSQQVIPLPHHNRGTAARFARNARRAMRGVPPLIDRFAGYERAIERAVADRKYDLGVVEHFWCAPYINVVERICAETVLDLHNIESVLHQRCATVTAGLIGAGHRRFGAAARKLESALLPRYSAVLAASEQDAAAVRVIAPDARVHVYPNAIPWMDMPQAAELPRVVFSGNFEYHPNIDAAEFLVTQIWPKIRQLRQGLRLRLVGRGDSFIRHILPKGAPEETGIELTGPVPDAAAEIAQARIVVAPLRIGSGTRIKILEAWAAGRCVVATTLGAEGLAAQDGVNIALDDDPVRFAQRVATLSDDMDTRQRFGIAGRRTFEHRYSWDAVWKYLDVDLQLARNSGLGGYTGN